MCNINLKINAYALHINFTDIKVYDIIEFLYSLLFLLFISPIMQLSIFGWSYGTDLKDITVYITNQDTNAPSNALCCTQF